LIRRAATVAGDQQLRSHLDPRSIFHMLPTAIAPAASVEVENRCAFGFQQAAREIALLPRDGKRLADDMGPFRLSFSVILPHTGAFADEAFGVPARRGANLRVIENLNVVALPEFLKQAVYCICEPTDEGIPNG
jgi:hypothetical protein